MSKEECIESINPKQDNGVDKTKSTFSSSNEGASMDIGNDKKGNKNMFSLYIQFYSLRL
jgi:hypothetical protein